MSDSTQKPSTKKTIYTAGGTDYQRFQDIISQKDKAGPPKLINSPKFPETPSVGKPASESAQGLQNGDDQKFLALPSPVTMDFAQTLKKLNAYPQMEGPFDVVQATPEEQEAVGKFLEAFNVWILLARLFFKTRFYKIEWEAKNKYDLVFMRLDPILLNAGGQSVYVHLTEIGIPSISGCNLDRFDIKVQGEKSKQPFEKINNRHRRDKEYKIVAEISCPSIDGKASYVLKKDDKPPEPTAEKGDFEFVLKGLKAVIGVDIVKIDEHFETEEIRYRPPNVLLNYDLTSAEITKNNVPHSSIFSSNEIVRLFEEYKDKEIIQKKEETAKRLTDIYERRVSPLIVQLRWIHQLHDIMYFSMVNEPDKTIPEFSKIQTKLVEVVFYSLLHEKFQNLILTSLKQESYEPFKKLMYFRECPEYKTVEKLNTLVFRAKSLSKETLHDEFNYAVQNEIEKKQNEYKKIVSLQFNIMKFFTESILI